eukprot:48672-Eustigmatos_ZCMA.PRE.1
METGVLGEYSLENRDRVNQLSALYSQYGIGPGGFSVPTLELRTPPQYMYGQTQPQVANLLEASGGG